MDATLDARTWVRFKPIVDAASVEFVATASHFDWASTVLFVAFHHVFAVSSASVAVLTTLLHANRALRRAVLSIVESPDSDSLKLSELEQRSRSSFYHDYFLLN